MISPITITLSGLQAAERRVVNSANNIANQNSTFSMKDGVTVAQPFAPQRVVQKSLAEGGVSTDYQPITPAFVPVYDPENAAADANGIVQTPNVNEEVEVVDSILAANEFKANLRVFKTTEDMMKSLDRAVDIKG